MIPEGAISISWKITISIAVFCNSEHNIRIDELLQTFQSGFIESFPTTNWLYVYKIHLLNELAKIHYQWFNLKSVPVLGLNIRHPCPGDPNGINQTLTYIQSRAIVSESDLLNQSNWVFFLWSCISRLYDLLCKVSTLQSFSKQAFISLSQNIFTKLCCGNLPVTDIWYF